MARPKTYHCPSCRSSFQSDDVRSGACPHCKTPIQAVQTKVRGRLTTEYVVSTSKKVMPVDLPPVAESTDGDYGPIISGRGEHPVVHLKPKARHYTVVYNGTMLGVGWIYCPECSQKLFQNIVISSRYVQQDHVCRKCKAKVTVIFK